MRRKGRGPNGMARFFLALFLIALGVFGLAEHVAINDQWAAMYPDDPARQNALARCAQEDGMFNRLTASGRATCYRKYLQVELAPAAPALAVGIPGAPTHGVPHPAPVRNNSNQQR